MRLAPSDDERSLYDAVRDVLAKECAPAVVRQAWSSGHSARLSAVLADLGVLGLTVPDSLGGAGFDDVAAAGVLEEAGRVALPLPLVESFAAVALLRDLDEPALAEEWLPRVASGDAIVAVGTPASPYVPCADAADLLLLASHDQVHAIPRERVRLTQHRSIDGSRRLFSVAWAPTPQTLLVDGPAATPVVAEVQRRLVLGTAAQLVGLARKLLDMSVLHVNVREQFGRPLGAFQAVQHRLADVLLGADFAAPVVARAAWTAARHLPTADRDAAMAKVFASTAAERAAYSALQVHGAIGYTREHDLHLFLMRAWTLAAAYGDAPTHRARVAELLLSEEEPARVP